MCAARRPENLKTVALMKPSTEIQLELSEDIRNFASKQWHRIMGTQSVEEQVGIICISQKIHYGFVVLDFEGFVQEDLSSNDS